MVKTMKKNLLLILGLVGTLSVASPLTVLASNCGQDLTVSESIDQSAFEEMINEIETIKSENPGLSEDEIIKLMDDRHSSSHDERGLIDIWNSLTDSEKKLCIRYPFDALKVNTARNIATEQTDRKFGYNGLGDRSDAFRHGIWNAEMTVLIGEEKAELFATAHEDKDVTGDESDGYPKTAHRDMDLHNNEVGRAIGEQNKDVSEDEMADIIYQDIYSGTTQFVWLHD